MKRMFLVEIDYEELDENITNNTEVLQDISVEVAVDNLLCGYLETNSIKENYHSVSVREIRD